MLFVWQHVYFSRNKAENKGAKEEHRMKKLKAVVFDMDGIIFDTERLVLECWVEIAEKYGFSGVEETFRECIGTNKVKTMEIVKENLGEDFPYTEFSKEASTFFREKTVDGIPQKKGVRDTLEMLKSMGIPLGLASSTRKAVVCEELKDAGLLDFFRVVMGGDQLKRSKPEPDIYLMTCEQLEVDPKECIAIEDSYNGILSAYGAGMCPVMIPDMLVPTEEMREKSAVILNDMTELIPWIKEHYIVED